MKRCLRELLQVHYQENLPSKSSDWGLPPHWKNYILALGILPNQASTDASTYVMIRLAFTSPRDPKS